MSMQSRFLGVGVALVLALVVGCTTTNPDFDFKDRDAVEHMKDADISVNGISSWAAIKKERKLPIAVAVDISDQSVGRAKPPSVEKLLTAAQTSARNWLAKVRAYRLDSVDQSTINRAIKTGDDINGTVYPFMCQMRIVLTSEIVNASSSDVVKYQCRLTWELIDNRTKQNGLGDNQQPLVVESMQCQGVQTRRRMLSWNNKVIGGDDFANAQSAYEKALNYCMIQFYGQLHNRISFGGVVSSFKLLDDNVSFKVKADAQGQGVVKNMQMLIMNEDQDRIAVGEVVVSANGSSTVEVWRWLSKSYRKELEAVAEKGSAKVEAYLDEHPLYALCLGLPGLPPETESMIKDYQRGKGGNGGGGGDVIIPVDILVR